MQIPEHPGSCLQGVVHIQVQHWCRAMRSWITVEFIFFLFPPDSENQFLMDLVLPGSPWNGKEANIQTSGFRLCPTGPLENLKHLDSPHPTSSQCRGHTVCSQWGTLCFNDNDRTFWNQGKHVLHFFFFDLVLLVDSPSLLKFYIWL